MIAASLPSDLASAGRSLGVPLQAWAPLPDDGYRAVVEVPSDAAWSIWPERGIAIWIGFEFPHVPPRVRAAAAPAGGLAGAIRALANAGWWLQEAIVETSRGTSASLPGPLAHEVLRRSPPAEIVGISGTWGDRRGVAVRGAIHDQGSVRAEDEQQAEEWLLVIHGLADG
jgi:hypothetical protein